MGDFTYPSNKPYGSSQIASLVKEAFSGNGYTSQQQTALQSAFVGIAGAESSGQTGIVNNTAFSGLPGYTSPGPNDTPEYSVGLFQMNLYDQGNYNASAAALGQPQLGQGQTPSSAQAYALGGQLASSPQAQAQAASTLYQSSQFAPWTDSYVSSAGGPQALYSSVTGGQAPPSSYPPGTAGTSSSASTTGSASGAINGQCDPTKAVLSWPKTGVSGVVSVGGGSIINQCQAKHLVGGLAVAVGGLVVLVGAALLFAGGHGVAGKVAEVAGAGVALVPGGEAVGAAAATAGHRMSAQSKNKGQASKAQKALRAPPAPSRKAQQAENEQQLQDAHAQGVMTGRSQGRQKNGLKMGYNRGSGSRYEEAA